MGWKLKIAITGDTHGQVEQVQHAISKQSVDMIFFTGDYVRDGRLLSDRLQVPINSVAGNCDHKGAAESEKLIELEGKRFYLVHGHQFNVKRGLQSIYYRAGELEAEVAVFGHTHIPICQEVNGLWLINPGSPTRPRSLSPRGTYMIITIEQNTIYPTLLVI